MQAKSMSESWKGAFMSNKVAIFIADGTEPVEAIAPVDVLRRGGIDVVMVSAMPRLEVTFAQNIKVIADVDLENAAPDDFDMLVVPGGSLGVENLAKNAKLAKALEEFMKSGRKVSSICAGPTILADLGLLEGRKATCYPGCQTNFPEGVYVDILGVVKDRNLITASGPGQALEFGKAMLEELAGKDVAEEVLKGMLVSS